MMMMMDTTTGIDDFEQKLLTVSSTMEESSGSNHTNNNNSTCCNDEDEQVIDSYICESNRLWIKKNKKPSPPISVLRYGLKDMQWLGEKKCHFTMTNVADRFVIPAQCQEILEQFMTQEEKKLVLVNTNSKKNGSGGGLKVKVVDRFGRKRSIMLKKWQCNKKYVLCKGWKEFVSKWVMNLMIASIDSSPATIVQMWCTRLPADKLFFGFDFVSASWATSQRTC